MQNLPGSYYEEITPYGRRRPVDEELLQEICRRIVEAFDPIRIVLFGSRARGDHREDSDVDLMIEMQSTEKRIHRAIKVSQLFNDRWWGMDILVYTPEELRARQNLRACLVPVIESEGKVLYQQDHGS